MTHLLNPIRATVAVLLSLTLLTGCASLPVARDLRSEARSGNGLLTGKPRLYRTDNGLLVSGYVTRGAFYYGSARMHLDIEVVSSEGSRLAFVPAAFFPNPIRHRRNIAGSSSYAERIVGNFPSGSRVRVVVHSTSLRECQNGLLPPL